MENKKNLFLTEQEVRELLDDYDEPEIKSITDIEILNRGMKRHFHLTMLPLTGTNS